MASDENKELNNNTINKTSEANGDVVEAVTEEQVKDNEEKGYNGEPKFKRRIFLIKRGLQFRYMGVILTAMFLVSLIVGWTVYFSIWGDISDPTKKSEELVEVFHQGNEMLIYRMAVVMLMISGLSVFVSHKIAGPVYRLEESAKTIASGDFSKRIRLRSGDELQDLADAFNTMTESLDKVVGEDKRMLKNLNVIISNIKKEFEQKTISDTRKEEIIKELTYIANELERISSIFKVSEENLDDGAAS
ncbi:MAG: HAMP domain-containing protein [Candidatus Wallbacteria bacterium]